MLKNLLHQPRHPRKQQNQHSRKQPLMILSVAVHPRALSWAFIKSVDKEDYERAVEYLDTKQPSKRAQQLAEELQNILNWGFSGHIPKLSHKPEGDLEDGLKSNRERIGVIKTSTGNYDIMLERVQRGTDPPVWLFSAETLRQLPDIHRDFQHDRIEQYVPNFLRDKKTIQLSVMAMDCDFSAHSFRMVFYMGNNCWSSFYLPSIH